MNSIVSDMC